MPDDLEQALRHGYELWNRRQFEALSELFHPDVEIDASSRVLNPARYRGLDGIRQLTEETFDVWEEWSIEPTRFLWNGNRVLVETRIDARGKGSGIRLSEIYYTVFTIEGAKSTVMEIHTERDPAFESAGLPADGEP